MKRQRSRNRGGGNGGGGKPQQNANRAFESNGPDGVKIRGAAQHVFEKYQQLARDALTAGDRVLAESYQQHAEHYFRVLRAVQPGRPASDIIGRDAFASGFDIDFEDETGGAGDAEAQADSSDADGGSESREWRQDGRRDERPRDDRQQQNERPREDRNQQRDRNFNRDDRPPREDRNYNRDDRPQQSDRQQQGDRQQRDRNYNRDDRPRDERPRDERPREDRPREERQRDERPRYDRNNDRGDRAERGDPLAVVEPRATPLTAETQPSSSPVLGSPVLRSQDGGVSHAPAFLQQQPRTEPVADTAEAAPKPKRRRAPKADKAADATATDIVSSEDA
jgi:hypothetical protein